MDVTAVDPSLHRSMRRVPRVDYSRRLPRAAMRLATRAMPGRAHPGVRTTWVRAGSLRLRVHRPLGPGVGGAPGLVWVHGGGLVIGGPKQDDPLCGATAASLGMTVVSPDYRLAPEHPFPAALEDVTAAWDWLQEHAGELGVDPARVAVGGESAGGGIAACLAQALHDRGERRPSAQWLFAPMLDDRTAADVSLDGLGHLVWDNRSNRFGWRAYLAAEPGAPGVAPYAAAARREDLSGLPPTWLGVGDIELFHDEVAEYARRLAEAGVDVTLDVVRGGAHGFENWAAGTELAQAFVARAQDWLRGR